MLFTATIRFHGTETTIKGTIEADSKAHADGIVIRKLANHPSGRSADFSIDKATKDEASTLGTLDEELD